jgi:hypothetical protein
LWLKVLETAKTEEDIDNFDFESLEFSPQHLLISGKFDYDQGKGGQENIHFKHEFLQAIQQLKQADNSLVQDTTLAGHQDTKNYTTAPTYFDVKTPDTNPTCASFDETMETGSIQVEKEIQSCQEAMSVLAEMGYTLMPYSDGDWIQQPVTEWRIIQSDNTSQQTAKQEAASVDKLLLAAQVISEKK